MTCYADVSARGQAETRRQVQHEVGSHSQAGVVHLLTGAEPDDAAEGSIGEGGSCMLVISYHITKASTPRTSNTPAITRRWTSLEQAHASTAGVPTVHSEVDGHYSVAVVASKLGILVRRCSAYLMASADNYAQRLYSHTWIDYVVGAATLHSLRHHEYFSRNINQATWFCCWTSVITFTSILPVRSCATQITRRGNFRIDPCFVQRKLLMTLSVVKSTERSAMLRVE